MNKTEVMYPYGFMFSDKDINFVPNQYNEELFLDRFTYYYDNRVEPHFFKKENSFIIIHGHFIHMGLNKTIEHKNLCEELLEVYENDYDSFLDELDFIGGRYIIIVSNNNIAQVYPDASATRSCYYMLEKNVVSSHLNLITDNFDCAIDKITEGHPYVSNNFDRTPYENIKSILPNFFLDLNNKNLNRFFPRKNNIYKNRKEIFEIVEKLWKSQVAYYHKNCDNLVFSLTGGLDSRVSLAMSRELASDIKFFTYSISADEEKDDLFFSSSLYLDKYIVNKILCDFPLNHKFFLFDNKKINFSDQEKNALSKNSTVSHGKYLIKHYNQAFPEPNVMHLRSNLLEIGRAFYMNYSEKNSIQSLRKVFYNSVIARYHNEVSKENIDKLFLEGIREMQYNVIYDYHILDLFYWENRMGRWFSEVLNETDSAFDTFLPFNMRAIIDISLSFNLEDRKSGYMFKELINRNFSVLNFYGINSEKNSYEKNRDNNIYKNKYFVEFEVFDIVNLKYSYIKSNNNCIFLPVNYLIKDCCAKVKFYFSKKSGLVNISLLNEYNSKKGVGYLKYEVYKNEKIILSEDISLWKNINNICIHNMDNADLIEVRVVALKDCQADSWEKASEIYILNYEEISSQEIQDIEITCTSPVSSLYNENINNSSVSNIKTIDNSLKPPQSFLKNIPNIDCNKDSDFKILDGEKIYTFIYNDLDIKYFANGKVDNKKLTIMLPGAVNRSKTIHNFQRHSWSNDIDGSVISFLDPTVHADNNVSIGWFQGNKENYAIPVLIKIIRKILDVNNLSDRDLTLFGSSAGGFTCLKIADDFPHSRIIVNNPQIYIHKYSYSDYHKLVDWVFPKNKIEYIEEKYKKRLMVDINILIRTKPILYYQNIDDSHHYDVHLMPFLSSIDNSLYEIYNNFANDVDINKKLKVVLYSDSNQGHDPLNKKKTLRILNS